MFPRLRCNKVNQERNIFVLELKKNDIYKSEIIDYTTEGSGICRINGVAVFVPSACVGDIAEIRILKTAKNYAYGKIERIISSSADRITPDCGLSVQCGGCTFRHINYEAELRFKEKHVKDTLVRIGNVDEQQKKKIVGCSHPDNYRNKAQLPFTVSKDGEIAVGFFASRTHRVIPLKECMLQSEIFNHTIPIVLEWANRNRISVYDEKLHTGKLRHLYMRYAEKTDELMVCIVANADTLKGENELVSMLREKLPQLKTVVVNVNKDRTNVITGRVCRTIYGDGYITDELCGLKFRISPLSFYQVNRAQAEKLYSIAADLADLKNGETLLDLYCGTGTIGLTMAYKAKRLIGAEIIPQAIDDAIKNSQRNNITNAEFICADAGQAVKKLKETGLSPDCIVIDPPRKGCSMDVISAVSEMSPSRVVYVSCDPATLARDIKLFAENGYYVKKAVPVDMFPRTAHVECVVLMTKSD